MPETNAEQSSDDPADGNVEGTVADSADDDRTQGEDSRTKPARGRLPARASHNQSSRTVL
jgi:hypothetical protein